MENQSASRSTQIGSAGLLSATYHYLVSQIMEQLAQKGYRDISKTQLHVLARFKENISSEDLSKRVQIPVQLLENITEMLKSNGYIMESSPPADIHTTRYRMTDKGLTVRSIVSQAQADTEQKWAAQIGEEKMQEILDDLIQLFDATINTQN